MDDNPLETVDSKLDLYFTAKKLLSSGVINTEDLKLLDLFTQGFSVREISILINKNNRIKISDRIKFTLKMIKEELNNE